MRWLGLLLALAVVGGSWLMFSRSGERLEVLENRIDALLESGDQEVEIPGLENEIHSLETTRTFNGILLAIGSAAFLGTLFVTFILPSWANRVSQSVYGSNAEVDDPAILQEARALVAKGEYEAAISAFRKAAEEDPSNYLPWTEMARIYSRHLDQPGEAVATLNEALADRDWPQEEQSFLLFRLADLYSEDPHGREMAVVTLRRVIQQFPESRHAMNARHRLKEWGAA